MKKTFYIIGIILLILVITNPMLSDFKEYKNSNYVGEISEREYNLFFCSIYKKDYVYLIDDGNPKHKTRTYLGILGNFFLLQDIEQK